MIVSELLNNKKPRNQWKNRFIYAFLGLYAGIVGAHNFYIGRKAVAFVQLTLGILWLTMIGGVWTLITGIPLDVFIIPGAVLAGLEFIWIVGDVFWVRREPDGDLLDDEARPLRILLITLLLIFNFLLPGIFFLTLYIKDAPRREGERQEQERMRVESEAAERAVLQAESFE